MQKRDVLNIIMGLCSGVALTSGVMCTSTAFTNNTQKISYASYLMENDIGKGREQQVRMVVFNVDGTSSIHWVQNDGLGFVDGEVITGLALYDILENYSDAHKNLSIVDSDELNRVGVYVKPNRILNSAGKVISVVFDFVEKPDYKLWELDYCE